MTEISIVEVPDQAVLGMRQQGKYLDMALMIPKIYQYAVEKGYDVSGHHPIFVCHETTVEEVKKAEAEGCADVEVAVPVNGTFEGTDKITKYVLPGGKMAKIIHKGPYEACEPTYEKLHAWLSEKGLKISGPTREVYLNDPREVSPEEILTEIYAPIE